MRIGAIEAGGTKFICGVGNEHGHIEDRISFPTEHPETTLAKVIDYFRDKGVEAMGIGSFGPIDMQPDSPTYGYITTTPKPGWENCNVVGTLKHEFPVPIGWDTDVNAAALGEVTWGRRKDWTTVYITRLAQALVSELWQGANEYTDCYTPRVDIFAQDAIRTITLPDVARIMAIAWREWRQGRPLRHAGRSLAVNCRQIIRRGRSNPFTLRSRSPRPSCFIRRRRSSWVVV